MTVKDLLQGKPFKHPLHPMLVHLPIGLLLLSLLFDLAALGADDNVLARCAFYTMLAGVISMVVAAIPGLVDYSDIRSDHPAKRTARVHMYLNLIATLLYAVNVVLRWPALQEPRPPALGLIFSLAGFALIGFSGYLGGVLIYDDGISVGRHRRRTKSPDRTITVPAAGTTTLDAASDPDGFIAVADVDALREGETLRADVRGHVMTIARTGDNYFAVQELCTHRFGPLSEGEVRPDAQIVCPWHNSCFDLRSGKVTQGPAKVDLKTYPVQVRDGRICVRVP